MGTEAPPPGQLDFRPGAVRYSTYADGTRVPALRVSIRRDGAEVGYADLHLHKNARGLSVGLTAVVYAGAGEEAGP